MTDLTQNEKEFNNYNDAIRAALVWLRSRNVRLEEAFEARLGGFGMRSLDGTGGYRLEFDSRNAAHVNVWYHHEKGPHYKFRGNEPDVRALWRQLYFWDRNVKRRSQQDFKQ
jgi:hypothetical protein